MTKKSFSFVQRLKETEDFAYQSRYECLGYAVAYVLRSMGEEVDGLPIIAFVKTSTQESYYHYLPIVGYDEENIYPSGICNEKYIEKAGDMF